MDDRRRGPYAKTARVRRGIVDAALLVFADTGYRATTMKEVAARAGISQRGLVHHFPTKEDVLLAVLATHEERSAQLLTSTARGDLVEGLVAVARHNLEQPSMLELGDLLSSEAVASDHPAHEHFTERFADLRAALSGAFEVLRRRGELRTTARSEDLAAMYVALIGGLERQWLYDRDAVDVEARLRDFLALVGLRVEHPDPAARAARPPGR